MTEDIKPELIKKTQDVLGQFIKKPVLTEKLLKKPPFRFLHDIITNVIRETGFLKGLYTDIEMSSDNIKDREAKIAFLQKLSDCLKIITEKNVTARPSKIVAGLEPAKTNELLQILAYALQKKLDSSAAVQQLQKGITKPKLKSRDDKKTEQKTNDSKTKSTPRTNKTNEEKKSSRKADEKSVRKTKESPRIKSDKLKLDKSKDETKKVKSINKTEKMDIKSKDVSPRNVKSIKEKSTANLIPAQEINVNNDKEDISINQSKSKEINEKQEQIKSDINSEILLDTNNQTIEETLEDKKLNLSNEYEKPNKQELELTSKESTERDSIKDKEVGSFSRSSDNAQHEPELMKSRDPLKKDIPSRPKTSLRPPSVRPSSARPGAPRLKDRNEIILPPDELIPMGKVNVIVENFSQQEDDNEETVIVQTTVELPIQEQTNAATDMPTEKGHLVSQILEQLGDNIPQESEFKNRVEVDWNKGNVRNRAAANKELERLRESIQTLTRAANPLGKLMNFLQEDVDSMRSELKMWIEVNEKLSDEIKSLEKLNEESIQPLREQLERLEDEITKQHEQISNTRASILQNEQKIKMLLVRES